MFQTYVQLCSPLGLDIGLEIGFCVLSVCLLVSCTNHWGEGGPLCKPDLELIITILESLCTWDLPVQVRACKDKVELHRHRYSSNS